MSSFTYMSGNESNSLRVNSREYDAKRNMKYYSLLAGPAYRINDYVNLYVLAGFAHTKAEAEIISLAKYQGNTTSLAYGAGVAINPVENISVNIDYEGTRTNHNGNISINGLNIGVGYRF